MKSQAAIRPRRPPAVIPEATLVVTETVNSNLSLLLMGCILDVIHPAQHL